MTRHPIANSFSTLRVLSARTSKTSDRIVAASRPVGLAASVLAVWMLVWCSGCASIPSRKQETKGPVPVVLWHDSGEVASLNLVYGAGGREHAPDLNQTFTFVKEDRELSLGVNSASPKFDAVDEEGVEWKVKLGKEPQSETAATRFLWAAGYFVDEDYYVPELKVRGVTELRRGREFVSPDGTVRGARLERKSPEVKKVGPWDWFNNPFVGTQEFDGLRTMMAFLNSWDLKAVNNAVYEAAGERRYVVSDLGATFGRTASMGSMGSKSSPSDYAASTFVTKTTPEHVDFEMRSRPFFLLAPALPLYIPRSRMQGIVHDIPRAHAQRVGHRLSMLSVEQVRDVFRASGYDPAEVEAFTQVVLKRIAALDAL